MSNPLATAYTALCDALANSSSVLALVAVGNIVRHDTQGMDRRDAAMYGDLPGMDVRCTGGGHAVPSDSTYATVALECPIEYRSGEEDLDATAGILALQYATLRALYSADWDLGAAATVVDWNITGWQVAAPDEIGMDEERNEPGWIATATVSLLVKFARAALEE